MGCTGSAEIPEDAYVKSNGNPQESGCFTDEYFSQEQKRLVKESWKLLDNNRVEKGVDIFLIIFQKRPDAKQLFPFSDLEDEELLKNSRFRGHSKRFMNAVGSTVDNLDALDVSCAPTLLQLGRRHAAVANFMNSYMDTFVEAIEEVFEKELGPEETPQVKQAWNAVFRFITSKIEEGYQDAISKQQQQEKLSPNHLPKEAIQAEAVIERDSQSDKHVTVHVQDISVTCPSENKEDIISQTNKDNDSHKNPAPVVDDLVSNQTNGVILNSVNHVNPAITMQSQESGDHCYVIENKQITINSISTEQSTATAVTTDHINH